MILLAFIIGAAVALFAYHMGRNNESPIKLPKFEIPFFRAAGADNGQTDPARTPAHSSRGM